jgi:hypothetical protein
LFDPFFPPIRLPVERMMASASHPFTNTPPSPPPLQQTVSSTTRRARSIISISTVFSVPNFYASSFTTISDFLDLPNSGGVKALDIFLRPFI